MNPIRSFRRALRAALFCGIAFALSLSAVAELKKGMSEDEVIAALGQPSSAMKSGRSKFMVYPDGTRVELQHGFVTEFTKVEKRMNTYVSETPESKDSSNATNQSNERSYAQNDDDIEFSSILIGLAISEIVFAFFVLKWGLGMSGAPVGIGKCVLMTIIISLIGGVAYAIMGAIGLGLAPTIVVSLGMLGVIAAIVNAMSGLGNFSRAVTLELIMRHGFRFVVMFAAFGLKNSYPNIASQMTSLYGY